MLSLKVISNEAPIGPFSIFIVSNGKTMRVLVEERDIDFPQINLELHPHYELDLRLGADERVHTPMAVVPCLLRGRTRPIRGELKWLDGGVSIAVPFGFLSGNGNH